jgi:hypothetical protein
MSLLNNAASAPSVPDGRRTRPSGGDALAVLATLAALALVLALLGGARRVEARARGASPSAGDDPEMLHMLMTPRRTPAPGDSARAAAVAATLRASIAKYRDTTVAVADGFRMFAPQVKTQKVYHFTRGLNAMRAAFRFDPAAPTSLLYGKGADGTFRLIGAMYTAPKRFGLDELDARVPLSTARWHRHVNWCVPNAGDGRRWIERRDGHPVFGPESPIATKAACDAVGGRFLASPLGWMVHANVMTSDDPAVIWGDDHAHGGEHESGAMMEMDHSRM